MNKFAFNATSFAIKQLYHLSKANVIVNGEENIPQGSIIFTINHFTRVETLILPYHIQKITGKSVWSLAHYSLFNGPVADFLTKAGAVSTRDPKRDELIINKLLTGKGDWIIFPEGAMIKSKKVVSSDGDFSISFGEDAHRPHTGAASFALRSEFYRQRLNLLKYEDPEMLEKIKAQFGVDEDICYDSKTYIVPVNLTYYPIRARENAINHFLSYLMQTIPERVNEEVMTEGAMLLDGVDIDIRFGHAIDISEYLEDEIIQNDIKSKTWYGVDDIIPSVNLLRNKATELMYRYMNGIYNLTTINHDHIFSSILKNFPFDEIDIDDFKRRAFLVLSKNIQSERLFFHNSVAKNQIDLLTDDRYEKFSEFLKFCQEKGLVERKENILQIIREKFFIPDNDTDIRLINPVIVFANEVEPLIPLAALVERISKESFLNVKRRVISYLLEKPVSQFRKDYTHYIGESSDFIPDEELGMPFYLKKFNFKKGIVLLHGFLSSPQEMRPLGEFLHEKGFNVYSVRFKGHGTSYENLKDADMQSWLDSAEEAIAMMQLDCDDIFLCGISLGAAVALILGAKLECIKGITAIAPPVSFINYTHSVVVNDGVKGFIDKLLFKKDLRFVHAFCQYPKITYSKFTPESKVEMTKISDRMFSTLYHVKKPVFVMQSSRDHIVSSKSATLTYERIGYENKSLLYVNAQNHSIINSKESGFVFNMIKSFMDNIS